MKYIEILSALLTPLIAVVTTYIAIQKYANPSSLSFTIGRVKKDSLRRGIKVVQQSVLTRC